MNDTRTARLCNRRACVAASVLRDVQLRASRVAGTPYGVMPHQFDDSLHIFYASRGDILFVIVFYDLSSVIPSFLAAWSVLSLFLGCSRPQFGPARSQDSPGTTHTVPGQKKGAIVRLCL